ncbi:MAG TPA: sulfite exporter TauE/SafE family protein [Candidatus Saccharibacteria bacterium]|nr:sulfite exporter TauE/SafE family protein [Candidatus Saccharibacteria bacterium]
MDILYLATFFVAFISSILSGIAGGGGGFVMSPYWLVSGMTPAQGAATGAFMATGMSLSSVAAFRNTDHFPKNKRLLYILSATALIGSVLGAIIVPKIDIQAFKYLLAFITIAALPLLFIKPNTKHRLRKHSKPGLVLAMFLLTIGSIITSSAFSILFALSLMAFFNMTVLQMTALRRLVGIVQSVVLFIAFTLQGFLIWQHALAGFIGGSIGSYIGTRYAVKKGEVFAKYALVIMSFAGAVALVV